MIPFLIVANRVVQREKHTLNGATLDVSLENSDRNKDVEKTIKITGLAAKTTKDSILNYFENKRRSGGGDVESVDFQSDTGLAFVTFVDVDGKYFKIAGGSCPGRLCRNMFIAYFNVCNETLPNLVTFSEIYLETIWCGRSRLIEFDVAMTGQSISI